MKNVILDSITGLNRSTRATKTYMLPPRIEVDVEQIWLWPPGDELRLVEKVDTDGLGRCHVEWRALSGKDAGRRFQSNIEAFERGCQYVRPAATTHTILELENALFGPLKSNLRGAIRASVEMAELVDALSIDDNHLKAGEEIADVMINLMRLAAHMDIDLRYEINRKVEINRMRKWQPDGTGCGHHIE